MAREDFPVVLAIVMLSAVAFVVINLVVDVIYTVLDPRVTMTDYARPAATESPSVTADETSPLPTALSCASSGRCSGSPSGGWC